MRWRFTHEARLQMALAILEPGDLICTGTPGKTTAIHPGDKLEVEIEGIGVLQNGVEATK